MGHKRKGHDRVFPEERERSVTVWITQHDLDKQMSVIWKEWIQTSEDFADNMSHALGSLGIAWMMSQLRNWTRSMENSTSLQDAPVSQSDSEEASHHSNP